MQERKLENCTLPTNVSREKKSGGGHSHHGTRDGRQNIGGQLYRENTHVDFSHRGIKLNEDLKVTSTENLAPLKAWIESSMQRISSTALKTSVAAWEPRRRP